MPGRGDEKVPQCMAFEAIPVKISMLPWCHLKIMMQETKCLPPKLGSSKFLLTLLDTWAGHKHSTQIAHCFTATTNDSSLWEESLALGMEKKVLAFTEQITELTNFAKIPTGAADPWRSGCIEDFYKVERSSSKGLIIKCIFSQVLVI